MTEDEKTKALSAAERLIESARHDRRLAKGDPAKLAKADGKLWEAMHKLAKALGRAEE